MVDKFVYKAKEVHSDVQVYIVPKSPLEPTILAEVHPTDNSSVFI